MTDTPTQVFIDSGKRVGSTLQNEAAFRRAIEAGSSVITRLNGVYFSVEVGEGGAIKYTALLKKPVGL